MYVSIQKFQDSEPIFLVAEEVWYTNPDSGPVLHLAQFDPYVELAFDPSSVDYVGISVTAEAQDAVPLGQYLIPGVEQEV